MYALACFSGTQTCVLLSPALAVGDVLIHKEGRIDAGIEEMFFSRGNRTVITFRKLLQSGDEGVGVYKCEVISHLG
ncbi:hypothetical protein GmHk_17G047525 [Glycine max]|nr:hypothetical protein GmHk_17G047525 [Glycine max]